ncbi:MAG: FkbM family methyltransferase [Segetibacter sp.]
MEVDNYYFLTLINTNSYNVWIKAYEYNFKTQLGYRLIARRKNSSDLEVFNQVWGRKEYCKATDILKKIHTSNRYVTIIDAGANVGYTTVLFKSIFTDAKIISIEPDENNFKILQKNIEINKLENVFLIKAGLWKYNYYSNLTISRDFRDNRDWSIQVKETDERTTLKGIGILDLIEQYNIKDIDLFKIDIEGAEKFLFEDKTKTKQFLIKTKVIVIEIHDEMVSRELIYEILEENSFTLFEFNDLTIGYKS